MLRRALAVPPLRFRYNLVVFAFLAFGLSACGINDIPTAREHAKAAWSEVLNQYQRRSDLIPNLVETVRGFAKQESSVLQEVTEARARATAIHVDADTIQDPTKFRQFQQAQSQLSGALGRLLAIQENYPDLRSNQNFLALQSQIEGTENRIAVARRDYIDRVRQYNTLLSTFPGMLWAATFFRSDRPMETFTISEEQMRVPQVRF